MEKLKPNEKSERTILRMVTLSHLSQHSYAGLSVLYPDIMRALNLNYTQLGIMTGTSSLISGFLQMVWSLLARYVPRRILLVFGNILISIGFLVMGSASRFIEMVGGKVVSGAGQAAQHPVGTSILAQKFSKERVAGALSIHFGLSYIGNIISPLLLSFIAISFGWRQALYVLVTVPLIIGMTVFYFLRGDMSASRSIQERERSDLRKDLKSAVHVKGAVLVIAAEAFAVGGSGMGVVSTYTPLFLNNSLNIGSFETSIIYVIAVFGGVIGTIFFGRLANRYGNLKTAALITCSSSVLILLLSSYSLFSILIVPHLFIIGFTSFGSSSLLQAHLISISTQSERDILIGLYFTLGFGCSSIWTTLTGLVIDTYGSFNPAWLLRATLGMVAFSLMALALYVAQHSSDRLKPSR